jgi:hypothetical protein
MSLGTIILIAEEIESQIAPVKQVIIILVFFK